jgi:predicted amidophosphoribosyltransferase
MRHARTQTKTPSGLHVCPECGSDLVQPTCWEQAAPTGHWRVWRRCPDCEWQGDGVFGGRAIDDYDEELDVGTRALSGELKEIERENMAEMASALVAALAADLITAEDFR